METESASTKQEEESYNHYRFNKIIATATIWFIVAVAIVIYKGLIEHCT